MRNYPIAAEFLLCSSVAVFQPSGNQTLLAAITSDLEKEQEVHCTSCETVSCLMIY